MTDILLSSLLFFTSTPSRLREIRVFLDHVRIPHLVESPPNLDVGKRPPRPAAAVAAAVLIEGCSNKTLSLMVSKPGGNGVLVFPDDHDDVRAAAPER